MRSLWRDAYCIYCSYAFRISTSPSYSKFSIALQQLNSRFLNFIITFTSPPILFLIPSWPYRCWFWTLGLWRSPIHLLRKSYCSYSFLCWALHWSFLIWTKTNFLHCEKSENYYCLRHPWLKSFEFEALLFALPCWITHGAPHCFWEMDSKCFLESAKAQFYSLLNQSLPEFDGGFAWSMLTIAYWWCLFVFELFF